MPPSEWHHWASSVQPGCRNHLFCQLGPTTVPTQPNRAQATSAQIPASECSAGSVRPCQASLTQRVYQVLPCCIQIAGGSDPANGGDWGLKYRYIKFPQASTSHSPQSHGHGRAEHHTVTIPMQSKLRAGLSRAACANIKNDALTIDLCRFTLFTFHGSS
jgi:hypothetical protein